MPVDSLKSMYKVKIREENTISTRRMSRGLERRKHRDDEVNKRRLLSDDMSPLIENNTHDDIYHRQDKPMAHEKVSTRLERLKQWRDERKRKTEQQKKDSKKPVFKVSPLKHIGESNLYKGTQRNLIKPGRQTEETNDSQMSAKMSNSRRQVKPGRQTERTNDSQMSAKMSNSRRQVKPGRQTERTNDSQMSAKMSNSRRQVKPGRQTERSNGSQMSAKMSNSSKQMKVASGQLGTLKSSCDSVVPADRKPTRRQPGKAASLTTRQQLDRMTESTEGQRMKVGQHAVVQLDRMTESTEGQRMKAGQRAQLATRNRVADAKVKLHQKGSRTDLANKLTVSAAAKAKANAEKPKAFLRAKSHVTRAAVQNQLLDDQKQEDSKRKEQQDKMQACEAIQTDEHLDIVCASEELESSLDSKELHLSDSAVSTPKHSTPAARRSVRGKKAPANTSTPSVDFQGQPHKVPEGPAQRSSTHLSAMDVEESSDPQLHGLEAIMVPEHALSLSQYALPGQRSSSSAATNRKKGRKVHIETGCPEHVDACLEHTETQVVHLLEVSNKENVAYSQRKSQLLPGTPKRRQSQKLNVSEQEMCADDPGVSGRKRSPRHSQHVAGTVSVDVGSDSSAPATAKRPRRSATVARPHVEVEARTSIVGTDDTHTQLPVDDSTVPKPHSTQFKSAQAKRRSVRIASLAFSSPADSHSEDEVVTTKYRKTPAVKRRQSAATHLPQEDRASSTFVSVSDEGTSHLIGDIVVVKMDMAATPRHLQHRTTMSGNSRSVSQCTVVHTSQLIDISHEGTAVSQDDLNIVYEVRKPVEVEASLRALQELAVKKLEGETSFIEVPLDESADGDAPVGPVSLSVPSIMADDVMVEDISSTTAVTDHGHQSTQPFTPRSHEMTTSVDTSAVSTTPSGGNAEISVTPRSSRSRGLSVGGLSFFKTPGPPASAAVRSTKRSKRRRTDMSTPLKSPEEMIEILKKSPMIEFTRRRSRHVRVSGVDQLSASVGSLDVSILTSEDTASVGSLDVSILTSEDTEGTTCPLPSGQSVAAAEEGPQVHEITQLDETGGVQHFRQLLLSERARLQLLCDTWSQISSATPNLAEDVQGQIRSTIGKAQLLMDQRFQQFSGLVDNCQFGLGEKQTTLTDLQGFWEMIYCQVEDVSQLFATLAQLQQNNWHAKQPSPAKAVRKRQVVKISKPKIKSNFAAFREEIIKRKCQAAVKSTTVDGDHTSETTKVFDAGFFKVTSPVRSSGRKSHDNTALMPAAAAAIVQASEDNLSQKVHQSAESSTDQTKSPVNGGNKENKLSNTPSSRLLPLSVKRLSYLPAVPSPLLNDITGLLSKKS